MLKKILVAPALLLSVMAFAEPIPQANASAAQAQVSQQREASGATSNVPAMVQHLDASGADTATVQAAVDPSQIVTTPLTPALVKAGAKAERLLKYRVSDNMPQTTNMKVLQGLADANDIASMNQGEEMLGYMPGIEVIPCAQGCVGNSDYDEAIQAFKKAYYEPANQGFAHIRGVLKVRVRWFNQRGYMARKVPFTNDLFAISFPLQGKLVTLSMKFGGPDSQMQNNVSLCALTLLQSMYQMGVGLKPSFMNVLLPNYKAGALVATSSSIDQATTAVNMAFGGDDNRSRIEPMTDADRELLPAIDGIQPNEVDPIQSVVILNL